jgi:hypothetical protein
LAVVGAAGLAESAGALAAGSTEVATLGSCFSTTAAPSAASAVGSAVISAVFRVVVCAAANGKGGSGGRKLRAQLISALTNPMPALIESLITLDTPSGPVRHCRR